MELDNCRISGALRESLVDFMAARREHKGEERRAIRFCGREKDYDDAVFLGNQYFEIIRVMLGSRWELIDEFNSQKNIQCDVLLDAEYMRGVTDAFAVFRALLCEDERRKAAC